VAALVLAGCGEDEEPAGGDTDPLTQVRAAVVQSLSTSFHVTLSAPGVEASGDVDPIGLALTLDITAHEADGTAVEQKVRVVGADAFVTLGKRLVPDVDPAKYIQFTAGTPAFASVSAVHLADAFDPAGLKGLAFAFTEARRTADGGFTGTLDLTKAMPGTSRGLLPAEPEQLRAAGGVVKDIPFEAAVDDGGYLTSMTVLMPAYGKVPAYASKTTLSKFDDPVTVERPQAAEITEVTEELRQILTD
jgi:hypothetical protein